MIWILCISPLITYTGDINYGQIDFGGIGGAAVLITLPVILSALFIRRWIVSGLTMGAVKG